MSGRVLMAVASAVGSALASLPDEMEAKAAAMRERILASASDYPRTGRLWYFAENGSDGNDGAQKIADKVNDDSGWTDAHKKYTEALVYRDYPTHAAIFNTEQSREEYFNEHFVPSWPDGMEVYWDEEMNQIMAEQKLVWNWTTEAYFAVKRGNERRLDTAAKALSGDLIALICDKVLVPNIKFKNPIELGFKYGFRKEVLGSLFDYVNSISEAGDMLVEQVVGERASGESGGTKSSSRATSRARGRVSSITSPRT